MELKGLYTEYEDDECTRPIHVHFDCPVCKTERTTSNFYGNQLEEGDHLSCEPCGAEFKLISLDSEENDYEPFFEKVI